MRSVVIATSIVLLAATFAGAPEAAGPSILGAGRGAPGAATLMGILGGTHPETVRVTAGDGVVRTVTWEEHFRILGATSLGGTRGSNADAAVPCGLPPVCANTGYGTGGGPFCDNSSGWVFYDADLTAGGPGSAYIEAVDHGPTGRLLCGGFFGEERNWTITMSTLPVLSGMFPAGGDGCYATVWTQPGGSYCPRAPDPVRPQSFLFFHAEGPGVKVTFGYGGGMIMDYFMGDTATVSYGPLPIWP